MNKKDLAEFLFKARAKTYAGGGGKVPPALDGSTQLEFSEGGFLYRDIYYTGKNTFTGLEAIYQNGKPVFSMCYYGNWGTMTEKEIDDILRGALLANPESRGYRQVRWEKDEFVYECTPDSYSKSIEELGGYESITKNGNEVYRFYYAGSILD